MDEEKKGKLNSSKIIGIIITVIISLGSMVFAYITIVNSGKENTITVNDSQMIVEGSYGETYQLTDFVSVIKVEAVPDLLRRTNGSSIKNIKKGYFDVANLGSCMLYVGDVTKPCIIITTNDIPIIINFDDESKTSALYDQLDAVVNTD